MPGRRSPELSRRASIAVDAQSAWPLTADRVLVLGSDSVLRIHDWTTSAVVWCDAKPMRVRCWSRGPGDACALGGWEGEVRWFAGGALRGSRSVEWVVSAIQPLDGGWIAGVWNGHLVVLGEEEEHRKWLNVDDGVFKVAVGADSVAVLGLGGSVAEYDVSGKRTRQGGPIDRAVDIAFADNAVVVLTEDGRLWTLDGNRARRPDRLPARGGVRLLARNGSCLLANDQGHTWRIDRAGTYPPDVRLPRGHVLNTSSDLSRAVTSRDGLVAYCRGGQQVKVWHQAIDAVVAPAGDAVVVTEPGRIELWKDEEAAS